MSEKPIPHVRVVCPHCESRKVQVQKTLKLFKLENRIIRYYLCFKCSKTFKTQEDG